MAESTIVPFISDVSHSPISDCDRYSRQVLFPGIGNSGQSKLRNAHVAVVGVGATGAATASLLARAGVGALTLIDRDFVEPSNLQRQILFDEADARNALPKAEAARRHIADFNAGVAVTAHVTDLVPSNIRFLIEAADIVLDCTDNFETRYLINDFCVQQAKPWIYAAAIGAYAATMNILPVTANPSWQPTGCLACLFPTFPKDMVETCDTAGILATAVNFAASIQTTEALKYLSGNSNQMRRTLLSYDLWSNDRSELSSTSADPACRVCAFREFRYLSGEGRPHITLCGRNSVQIHEHTRPVDLVALAIRLSAICPVRSNGLLLRFDLFPYTITVFQDGRALIQGTTDIALARSLYARFIGM